MLKKFLSVTALSTALLFAPFGCGDDKSTSAKAAGPVVGDSVAGSDRLAKEFFGPIRTPSDGAPQSIGQYALGCIAGAVALPETGPTWQAMRLSRNRNYGHPVLVDYLKELSRKARDEAGWAGLYVGDMSQPRGGPMTSGHASHQLGLDADIWMLPPQRLNLTRTERENLSSISVVSSDYLRTNNNWTNGHFKVMRAAASDNRVARIFVTPAVKIEMCRTETGNRDYLRKIRPWWGHNYHFHVRLDCPAGSPNCVPQWTIPKGNDGCAFAEEFYGMHIAKTIPLPKPDPNAPKPQPKQPKTLARMPAQCAPLVQ